MHVGQDPVYTKEAYVNVLQAGLVAYLFLAVLGGLPMLSNRQAPSATAAYIMTVDVNPSLELQISAEHTVLALDGLNQQEAAGPAGCVRQRHQAGLTEDHLFTSGPMAISGWAKQSWSPSPPQVVLLVTWEAGQGAARGRHLF